MSDPRYSPRDFMDDYESFGRVSSIRWFEDQDTDAKKDQLVAAKMQHHYALLIYRGARHEFGSLKGYAIACGMKYERLLKFMRGESVMRFEHLAQAERVLGGILVTQRNTPPGTMRPR